MGNKAFAALCQESARTTLPNSFTDDLHVHDRARLLSSDAPPHFGWVLRETGTLLLDSRMEWHSRSAYRQHLTHDDKQISDRFYVWDGARLREVPCETMFAEMEEQTRSYEVRRANWEHPSYNRY